MCPSFGHRQTSPLPIHCSQFRPSFESMSQDKLPHGQRREVKRKLLELTQNKLSSLDCQYGLRNKVLLQSAMRNAFDAHLKSNGSSVSSLHTSKIEDDNQDHEHCLRLSDSNIDMNDSFLDSLPAKNHHHSFSNLLVSSPRKRSLNCDLANDSTDRRRATGGKRLKLFRTRSFSEEPMETSSSSSSSSSITSQVDDELTLSNLTSYFLQLKTQQN